MEEFITAGWRHHGVRVIGFGFVLGLIAVLLPVAGAVAATDRPAVGVVTSSADENVDRSRADSGERSGESSIARTDLEGPDYDQASPDASSRDQASPDASSGDQANGPAAAEPSDDAARASHAGGSQPSQAGFAQDRGSERAIDAGSESPPGNDSGAVAVTDRPAVGVVTSSADENVDRLRADSGERSGESSIARTDLEGPDYDRASPGESSGDQANGPAAAEPSDDAARASHAGGSRPSQAGFAQDRGSERASESPTIDAGSESSPGNVSGEPSGDHLVGEFSLATAERERSGDDLEDPGESWRDGPDGPAAAAGRAPNAGSEFSTRAGAVDGAARESAYAMSWRAAVSDGDSDWSESPSGAEGGVDESSSETDGDASGVEPSAPAEPHPSAVRPDAAGADHRLAPSDIEAAQRARPRATSPAAAIGLPLDRKGARVGSGPLMAPQSDRATSGRRSSARHSAHDRAASGRRSPARPKASPQRHVGQGAAGAASAKDAAPGPGPSGAVLVSSTLAVVGALLLSRRRTRVSHSILYTSRIERPG